MHMIPAVVAKITIEYLRIDAPEIEVLFFWFSLSNPLCVYILSFLFDTDAMASIIIRIFYFVVGGAAPITLQILSIFNVQTQRTWAPWLRQFFVYAPVFNLNYGYLNTVNRFILSFHGGTKEAKLMQPSDWHIAGESIYVL